MVCFKFFCVKIAGSWSGLKHNSDKFNKEKDEVRL